MKKKILLTLLFFSAGLIVCLCMEKKYKYNIMVTSADGYECMISWSGCYMGEAGIPFSAAGSWGEGRAIVASGPEEKSLPDTISLVYYSLTENQFYGLNSGLPARKIESLLDARYKQKGYEDASYFMFTIGIAPCGFVSLWLGGDAGRTLIDTFRAEKITFNYRRAFPTRTWNQEEAFIEYGKALYPFIRKEMDSGRISSAYWESLNKRYKWKLSFNDPRFSLYNYYIYSLNQESRLYLTDPDWPMTESEKVVPAELKLYLQHKLDPVKYKVVIKLRAPYIKYKRDVEKGITVQNHMNKSRSLLRFFEGFYQKAGDKDVSIYVDFDDSMQSLKLKLKSGDLEEEFPDYTYRIYDSETYDYK